MATAVETPPTEQAPQPTDSSKANPEMKAGAMGAALGLGVGLLFGELLVPGAILVAAAGAGYWLARGKTKT